MLITRRAKRVKERHPKTRHESFHHVQLLADVTRNLEELEQGRQINQLSTKDRYWSHNRVPCTG